MVKGKTLTMGYWNGLERDTKARALKLMGLPEWMADDKVTNRKDIDWQIITKCARISDSTNYKLIMHGHMYIN